VAYEVFFCLYIFSVTLCDFSFTFTSLSYSLNSHLWSGYWDKLTVTMLKVCH